MAELNPGLILAGQPYDWANSVAQGQALGQQRNEINSQNALASIYQQQGPGILAGDPAALNTLARVNPGAAMEAQSRQMDMTISRAELDRVREQTRVLGAQAAATAGEAQSAQALQEMQVAVSALMSAETPEAFATVLAMPGASDAIERFLGPGAATFENRDMIISAGIGLIEGLGEAMSVGQEANDFSNFKVVGNTIFDLSRLDERGMPTAVGTGQGGPGSQMSFTLPDGTAVRFGENGLVPAGQDQMETAAPRDAETLGRKLSEADANLLSSAREAATAAGDLESIAGQLEVIAPKVGYTGPGGDLYGTVDDLVGVLPGDSGARGALKSLSTDAQLTFTAKTKGAITEREMALFASAVPSLNQRGEANILIARVLRAGAARVQSRSAFFDEYLARNGSLQGAQDAWRSYMTENPILADAEGDGITVNPEGDWRAYLPGAGGFADMTAADILSVDVTTLNSEDLTALMKRMEELGL